jgi:molybdate transport system substrate-binding protein
VVSAVLCSADPALAVEITVQAAASLSDALREAGRVYEKSSADRIAFNFAASNLLARQIEAGAPADLFISADEPLMDRLGRETFLAPDSRVDLLSNTLAVVVATDSALAVRGARDLSGNAVRSVALAEPASVPAGIYARLYLEKLGLWERISGKVIPVENVRAALAAVEAGNADAAIVYRTDALLSRRVRLVAEIPGSEGPRIRYPAAVLRESLHPGSARRFLKFLRSNEAMAIFLRAGFLPPD